MLLRPIAIATAAFAMSCVATDADSPPSVPNRFVVLTFDDSVKSHFTVVRPILKKYCFGATFFVTEGFDFATNKRDFMTWEEIAILHKDGFEIGNHTRDHLAVNTENLSKLDEQIKAIANRCEQHGIPKPISFAYPGNAFDVKALPILRKAGIEFARRGVQPELPYRLGNGIAYEIGFDDPLLIPTTGDARPNWEFRDFVEATDLGRGGNVAVLQFHGVPDLAHPWVHTDPAKFESYMRYLAKNQFTVLAMRDIKKYVLPVSPPNDPEMVIRDRSMRIAASRTLTNVRKPIVQTELKYWLENMAVYHQYTDSEITSATGLDGREIQAALKRFGLTNQRLTPPHNLGQLRVLPYPGGRHPRSGFRDGAIRPQRETKCSVFLPWKTGGYVVLDVPEAIWMNKEDGRELLYLAHTHVTTHWERRKIDLERLEWTRHANGTLSMQRRLPNGVSFGTEIEPEKESVRMKMWLENRSDKALSGLKVQACAMLAYAKGFEQQTRDNKQFMPAYSIVHNKERTRWIIYAWRPISRSWGNVQVPCLHSDPQFPDCAPGETKYLRGWISFFSGKNVDAELRRIEQLNWWRESDAVK